MTGEKKTKNERFGWRSSFNAFSMTISKDLSLKRGIRRRSAWTHFRSGKRWRWSLMTFLGCMWVGHLEAIMDEWTCENLPKKKKKHGFLPLKMGKILYPSFKSGNSGSKIKSQTNLWDVILTISRVGFFGFQCPTCPKPIPLPSANQTWLGKPNLFFPGKSWVFMEKSSANGGVSGGCSILFRPFSIFHQGTCCNPWPLRWSPAGPGLKGGCCCHIPPPGFPELQMLQILAVWNDMPI